MAKRYTRCHTRGPLANMGVVSQGSPNIENPSDDDSRKLVQRILESPQFRRASRLRALLIYLSERALEQPPIEMREQELGAKIFGRVQNYNTTEDPIVRVHVSQLRKKLKEYFENEGKREGLIIDIPRGSYLPQFVFRSNGLERTGSETDQAANSHRTKKIRAAWAIFALVAMAVIVTVALVMRSKRAATGNAALAVFWTNLIEPNQRNTIVLADSCLAFAQDIAHRPISLSEYLAHDPKSWLEGANVSPAEMRDLELLMSRQYTSLADLNGLRRILLANPQNQQQINVVFARDFTIRGINTDNLILLGSRRSNPWVELFDSQLKFQFDYDERSMKAVVRNKSPQPGEASVYSVNGLGLNIVEGYADIALLPSAGHLRKVLILEGTDMEATEAAGKIVSSETELRELLSRLSWNGSDAPFFEAFYKTRRLAGAPQEARLLLARRIRAEQ